MRHMRDLLEIIARARPAAALALAATLVATPAVMLAQEHHHGGDSDWLLFPSAQGLARTGSNADEPQNDHEWAVVDVLFSHSLGRFRALAETEVATDEVEIERLQFGWEFSENTLGWIGRFHQPSSAWNIEHHHGQYLQTAITRPNIERWEDEGGLIPQHVTGLLLETRGALGANGGLAVAVGGGAAPVLHDGSLEPIYVLRTNTGGHRGSWSGRIAYLPDLVGDDSIGLVVAQHDVNVVDPNVAALFGANDVQLDVVGAFAKFAGQEWRLQSAYYYVDVHFVTAPTPRTENFGAGYLQIERSTAVRLTPFARLETSANAGHSTYVSFQPREFELRRELAGLRWDVSHNQALTIEAGRATTLIARFNEVRLQWSAVWP